MPGNELDRALVRRMMDLLAAGLGPMEVARQTGVSKSEVYRRNDKVGGVYRPTAATYRSGISIVRSGTRSLGSGTPASR